jgi:hypothetical protein
VPEVTTVNAAAAHRSKRYASPRLILLAPILCTAAAAAGCSTPDVTVAANPVAAVRDAATSSRIHTARVATVVTMAVGGGRQEIRGLGEFDFDRQIGSIAVTTARSPGHVDEVVTPTTLYLRQAQAGKWKSVDTSRLPDGDLISAGYTNPLLGFALLRGVAGTGGAVHYVGPDSVRGTAVAHYAGTLDLTASAEAASDPVRSALSAAARSFSQKTVPFDVYLDAQGRVRRIITHYAFAAQAPQHDQTQITATTDLYELDNAVIVSTPSAEPAATEQSSATPRVTASATPKTTQR